MLNHILSSFFVVIALVDFSFLYTLNTIYTRTAPKWVSLYILAVIGIVLLLCRKKFEVKIPNFSKYFYGAYVIGILITLASAPLGYFERSLSEKFLFISLAILSNVLFFEEEKFLEKLRKWIFLATPITYFFAVFFVLTGKMRLFENPHHFSEALAITTIIQGYFLFLSPEKKKTTISSLETIVFLIGLICIVLLKSRTALLGSGLGLSIYAFIVFSEKSKQIKIPFKYIFITISLIFSVFGFLNLQAGKMKSLNIRQARWENTLEMIKDNPLGVGLGNFFSGYTQYQNKSAIDEEAVEGWILENPHNFFLENAAEEGLLNAAIILVFIFFLLFKLFKLKNTGATPLLKALSSFIFLDALFNYPQDNPYTFFVTSFCLGAICFKLTANKFHLEKVHKTILACVCIVLLVYFPVRYYTAYFMTISTSEVSSRKACSLDNQIWFACLNALDADWKKGNYDDALDKLSALNKRFIGHYVLQKKEIELLWKAGKKQEACAEAKKYISLFNGKSSLSQFVTDACQNLGNN